MMRAFTVLLQKRGAVSAGANAYLAGASKTGNDEKWAHAAMEYIYEKNHLNDSRKRQDDVAQERGMAAAYDNFSAANAAIFDDRLSRLLARMNESLAAMEELGLHDCLAEAVSVVQSEQPPGNYRRPTLTPPVPGYEPGFGLDVPQLKGQQAEYPTVHRPTDHLQFSPSGIASGSAMAFEEGEEGEGGAEEDDELSYFPYVDAHQIEDLATQCSDDLRRIHGEIREAAPLTGTGGEAWEAYVALQRKALARQQLIFALSNDPDFRQRYDASEELRRAEWARREMVPLDVEAEEGTAAAATHFAQVPAYQPFRAS